MGTRFGKDHVLGFEAGPRDNEALWDDGALKHVRVRGGRNEVRKRPTGNVKHAMGMRGSEAAKTPKEERQNATQDHYQYSLQTSAEEVFFVLFCKGKDGAGRVTKGVV